jgi:hypothetical protein
LVMNADFFVDVMDIALSKLWAAEPELAMWGGNVHRDRGLCSCLRTSPEFDWSNRSLLQITLWKPILCNGTIATGPGFLLVRGQVWTLESDVSEIWCKLVCIQMSQSDICSCLWNCGYPKVIHIHSVHNECQLNWNVICEQSIVINTFYIRLPRHSRKILARHKRNHFIVETYFPVAWTLLSYRPSPWRRNIVVISWSTRMWCLPWLYTLAPNMSISSSWKNFYVTVLQTIWPFMSFIGKGTMWSHTINELDPLESLHLLQAVHVVQLVVMLSHASQRHTTIPNMINYLSYSLPASIYTYNKCSNIISNSYLHVNTSYLQSTFLKLFNKHYCIYSYVCIWNGGKYYIIMTFIYHGLKKYSFFFWLHVALVTSTLCPNFLASSLDG